MHSCPNSRRVFCVSGPPWSVSDRCVVKIDGCSDEDCLLGREATVVSPQPTVESKQNAPVLEHSRAVVQHPNVTIRALPASSVVVRFRLREIVFVQEQSLVVEGRSLSSGRIPDVSREAKADERIPSAVFVHPAVEDLRPSFPGGKRWSSSSEGRLLREQFRLLRCRRLRRAEKAGGIKASAGSRT